MSKRLHKRVDEFLANSNRLENDYTCAQHGWKAWPENATPEERAAALDAIMSGEDYEMYPPGYIEEPVESSGKLDVEVEGEAEKPWWKIW